MQERVSMSEHNAIRGERVFHLRIPLTNKDWPIPEANSHNIVIEDIIVRTHGRATDFLTWYIALLLSHFR